MTGRFDEVRRLLLDGREAHVFPAAVIEVGRAGGTVWTDAVGTLRYEGDASPCGLDTIFDLASLTKVMATTPLAMRAVAAGRISLDTPVAEVSADWRGSDRGAVTVRQLLDHSSGLPAHAALWRDAGDVAVTSPSNEERFERVIGEIALAYVPGTQSVYSDLGFMLLGIVLSRIDGVSLRSFVPLVPPREPDVLVFCPDEPLRSRIAPTENDPWRGRELVGEVHDENAAALGGIAGHAGLFGTAGAVGDYARLVLRTFREPTPLGDPDLIKRFARRTSLPGSSRALGWDTMLPTSSCGTRLASSAIGHVGFTGTSLWIDWEHDLYVVLLTNRVHPTRDHTGLTALRPRLHDAVVAAL